MKDVGKLFWLFHFNIHRVLIIFISSEETLCEEENSSDDGDDNLEYFYDSNNGDIFIQNHLSRKQFNLANFYEQQYNQHSKSSNKKKRSRRQIKTKHVQSIKIKLRNEKLCRYCRLDKIDLLDPHLTHYERSYSSSSLCPYEDFTFDNCNTFFDESTIYNPLKDYIINEYNISNQTHFDDDLLSMLLHMQNRDL